MLDAPRPPTPARISTGVAGLDVILGGGLAPNRLYLLEGVPGTGKTTLALQFLLEGHARGEPVLYVTLSETAEELATVVDSHGWRLDGINLFELASAEAALGPERGMTLLHPWEVELGETVKLIVDEVERTGAVRIVFDSLSEMRLLAQDMLRFRRQILALKQFFAQRRATVLLLDDHTAGGREDPISSFTASAMVPSFWSEFPVNMVQRDADWRSPRCAVPGSAKVGTTM
jgi:circadian clock protein KaiC